MKIRQIATVAWGLILLSSFSTMAQAADGDHTGAKSSPPKQHVWTDGARYEGDWDKGQPHGYGSLAYADGSQYWGHFEHGRRHGYGKLKYLNGDQYEGNWLMDHPSGRGKLIYANGSIYEGNFKDGLHEGLGKQTYPDGTFYEGTWKDDKPHGFGKLTFVSGGLYEGAFSKGKPSGKGRYFYPNGDIYSGQWQNGNQHGHGRIDYSTGGYYEGQFVDGMRHGDGELMSALGQRYSGPFEYNEAHGEGLCSNGGKPARCFYRRNEKVNSSEEVAKSEPASDTKKKAVGVPVTAAAVTIAAATVATSNAAASPAKITPTPKAAPTPIADPVTQTKAATGKQTKIEKPAPKPQPNTPAIKSDLAAAPATQTAKASQPKQPAVQVTQTMNSSEAATAAPVAIPFAAVYSEEDAEQYKVKSSASKGSAGKTSMPDARQQFADTVNKEKEQLQHLSVADLRQDRSDIYFTEDWEEKDLMAIPEQAWWQKKSAMFSDSVLLISRHGDTEIRMLISDYKGPGSYDLKEVIVASEANNLKANKVESGVIVVDSEYDGWLDGTFEFKVKDKSGKSLAFDHGAFHLGTKEMLPGYF